MAQVDTSNPNWWKSYTVPQLLKMFSMKELQTLLPPEALSVFPKGPDISKSLPGYGEQNPNVEQQFVDWVNAGGDQTDMNAFRQHLIGIDAPDPGAIGGNPIGSTSPTAGTGAAGYGLPERGINEIAGTDINALSQAEKGAYFNFPADPYGASQNIVRSLGYNPVLNPYTQGLGGSVADAFNTKNFLAQLNGEDPLDFNTAPGAAMDLVKNGLAPTVQSAGGAKGIMAKLAELLRSSSNPEGGGLSLAQRNLASQYNPGLGAVNDDQALDNLSQTLGGLFRGSYGNNYARQLTKSLPNLMDQYKQFVAPRNPTTGFLDWLNK